MALIVVFWKNIFDKSFMLKKYSLVIFIFCLSFGNTLAVSSSQSQSLTERQLRNFLASYQVFLLQLMIRSQAQVMIERKKTSKDWRKYIQGNLQENCRSSELIPFFRFNKDHPLYEKSQQKLMMIFMKKKIRYSYIDVNSLQVSLLFPMSKSSVKGEESLLSKENALKLWNANEEVIKQLCRQRLSVFDLKNYIHDQSFAFVSLFKDERWRTFFIQYYSLQAKSFTQKKSWPETMSVLKQKFPFIQEDLLDPILAFCEERFCQKINWSKELSLDTSGKKSFLVENSLESDHYFQELLLSSINAIFVGEDELEEKSLYARNHLESSSDFEQEVKDSRGHWGTYFYYLLQKKIFSSWFDQSPPLKSSFENSGKAKHSVVAESVRSLYWQAAWKRWALETLWGDKSFYPVLPGLEIQVLGQKRMSEKLDFSLLLFTRQDSDGKALLC